jgi:hypothetical protein
MTTKAPVLPSLRLAQIPAEFRGPRLESRRCRDVIAMSYITSLLAFVYSTQLSRHLLPLSTFLSSSKAALFILFHTLCAEDAQRASRTRVTSINLVARVVTFLHENDTSLRQ